MIEESRRVRISYVSDIDSVNSNYRAYQPMQALPAKRYEIEWNRAGEPPFSSARLAGADVVHVHRYLGGDAQKTVERLRAQGIGIVWDNDDDIANIPRANPNYAKYGGARRTALVRTIATMLRSVDVVTTPSAVLAQRFRDAGAADVRVIENHLPDAFPGTSVRRDDGITLVWLAGLEHQIDYQRLRLQETLLRLLDAHRDLRILSVGLGLGLKSDRYEHIPQADFLDLPRVLARGDFGIAPLVEMPWNEAKSNVKLKEYAAAGLPWLASPIGPYTGMGESQGGLAVADDGWHEAIDRMIGDARGRKKLAKRATKWAKGETISKHIGEWEAVYRDAAAAGRARRAGA